MKRSEETPEERRASLLEILDELIQHINTERMWFKALCFSSVILAPVSLVFTLYMFFHQGILRVLSRLNPIISRIFLFYLFGNLLISALWLIFGLKEYSFIRKWNDRFKSYFSLKERLDRELREEFEK